MILDRLVYKRLSKLRVADSRSFSIQSKFPKNKRMTSWTLKVTFQISFLRFTSLRSKPKVLKAYWHTTIRE